MNKKTTISHYNRILTLFILFLQFNVGFSQTNYDPEDPNVFENDDIVVYRNPVTEEVQIIAVKRITDNTFPNHIIIDGTDHPIYTISPIRRYVEWPEEKPDTLIIPEGIRHIGNNFTVDEHVIAHSKYRNLRCLKLPDTLESIGENAFNGNSIENLIIPHSVVNIGREAFDECNIKNPDLGKVQSIGAGAFRKCGGWVKIPEETRIIGRGTFDKYFNVMVQGKTSRKGYPEDSELFFLHLSPVDINPVVEFLPTFGSNYIPYVACASEFLRPEITAKYQSDMPEVFDNRAMIHLESSPVPLYFSFEETGEKEGLWEPGIDLWALTGKNRKKESENSRSGSETKNSQPVYKYETDRFLINNPRAENKRKDRETEAPLPESEPEPADGTLHISYPVKFRMDTSSLPENKKESLRVTYNDMDITDSLVDDSFTIWCGKPFDNEGYISGAEPIYNRIKIILEE